MSLKLQGKLFVAFFWVVALCTASSFLYTRALLQEAHFDDAVALAKRGVLFGCLIGMLSAVGISKVVAWLSSRTARALTATAEEMAAGDLSARARVSGTDELAKLGAALDQLAENLSLTVAELRAQRDRLDGVLSGMAEGVLLLDQAGRVALVNPALRAMSLIGTDVEGKEPIEVIRNAELSSLLVRARASSDAVSGELELSTAATASRLLVRTRSLAGKEGGLVAVFVDVTELRRLETLRRDFVANASHELRTPIASIHSAAETLVAGAGDAPDTRARFLDIITRNAARLHHLVDDMLDLSRIESRGFSLTVTPVQLSQVAKQVLGAVGEHALRKNIQLQVDLPRELQVQADAGALEQVLVNLVDNAIKYCPSGSRVVIRYERTNGVINLVISDDGPGIDSKHLPRLFERFYRIDSGRSRDVGGTGLGLAIVKHLVEAMKGTVAVQSELGKGTTFSVRLPVV